MSDLQLHETPEECSESSGCSDGFGERFSAPIKPITASIEKGEPYPVDALGPLKSVTRTISEYVQSPLALIAQSVLSAVSIAAQNKVNVRNPLSESVGPVSCFLLTVALSGERKSSGDKICLAPVTTHERAAYENYLKKLKEYEHEISKPSQYKRKGITETSTKPLNPMMLMPEPTIEALEKHEGNSIGIYSDEGGRLFGGHGMSADNRLRTISGLSTMWDGNAIRRARASDSTFIKYDFRVSLHLMIQPYLALQVLRDTQLRAQGLLPRCLISYPESTMGQRIIYAIRKPSEGIKYNGCYQEYDKNITSLLESENSQLILELELDAQQHLMEYANHIEKQLVPGGALRPVSGFASKTAEHALRLSALLATYSGELTITVENLLCGISLAEHYLDEAVRLIGSVATDQITKDSLSILEWITNKNYQVIHLRMLTQKGPNRLRKDRDAQTLAIQKLIEHGYLQLVENLTIEGTINKRAWRVNVQI